MKNLRKILPETVVMCLSYLIILIAMIVSVSLDAWATTGGGFKVPDRWLYVPTVFFFVLSLCQAIIFLVRKGKAGYGQATLSIIKLLVVFAVECIIDLCLDPVWSIVSQTDSTYLTMVIIFLVALMIAVISEIFGNLRLRKQEYADSKH